LDVSFSGAGEEADITGGTGHMKTIMMSFQLMDIAKEEIPILKILKEK
jgi:hypothetical protein